MSEQEKAYNAAAINRIEGKLDDLLIERKVARAVAVMVVMTLLICLSISIQMDRITETQAKIATVLVQMDDKLAYMNNPPVGVYADEPVAAVLTEDERDLVERIVAAEARGESIEGMAAVAQVIRDRSTAWDMTVTDVCYAPGQFAAPYSGEISPEIVQAVYAVFDGGVDVLEVPVTHFHADYVDPYWTSSKVNRGSIGRHTFYY